NYLTVHFIDVGQGDSILLILPDGKNVLLDTGIQPAGPHIVKYLKDHQIKHINHLISTHPHDDHIGGIFSIASEFEIDNYYDNGFSNFSSTLYRDYIKLVRGNKTKYNILQAGDSFTLGDTRIDILNPLLPPTGNLNEDSVVVKLVFGRINILLSGDLGNPGERRLINKAGPALASQILKTGHHGDRRSVSDDFLKAVKPEAAIISVGSINKYGHPHKEILDRLRKNGINIYRTDQNGNIVLKTDGRTYSIQTEK
ncbi:MAG: ComEC/Rec2 family competence protein, partial [Nitrospirota bacterium]